MKAECFSDPEERKEVEEGRIEYLKRKGDQHFTKDGRGAEMTIDLVLQARAKVSENRVNGPEDAAVSEMIKQLPQEKIYIITKFFQERFMGQTEAPSSWKIVKRVFLRKPDTEPTKGIRSYWATALTLVMSTWYAACIILRMEKGVELESWKKLHVVKNEGISCWEWQEDRKPMKNNGSVRRPTMYLDIKTAFHVVKLTHIAQIMKDHNIHGWIIAALLREMDGLEGQAMFECVESDSPRERRSPQIVAENGHAALGKCGTRMGYEKNGCHFRS